MSGGNLGSLLYGDVSVMSKYVNIRKQLYKLTLLLHVINRDLFAIDELEGYHANRTTN